MDANPITLIVGTGAAVLIARTFYESFSTARGHSSALLKKDSKSKRSSKKPSAASSKESNVHEVTREEDKSVPAIRSSSASQNASGSGSSKQLADTLTILDQKLVEFVIQADAESSFSQQVTHAASSTPFKELSDKLLLERALAEEQEEARQCEDTGSPCVAIEAIGGQSLEGLSLANTSGAVNEGDDYIQLHACSHLPDDATKQSQSGVHVSVDITKNPDSGVHVSVDVMKRTDTGRAVEHAEQMSQSLVKPLEGSTHLSERLEHVSDKGVLHLESAVYAKNQSESDKHSTDGNESLGQPSERGSRVSERTGQSYHDNDATMTRPESSAHDAEHLANVDLAFESVTTHSPRLSELLAHSFEGYENASERSAQDYENAMKHLDSAPVSEHGHDDTANRPESDDQKETEYGAERNSQYDEDNEAHNSLHLTSSGIDQEIRRSIALESLNNAKENHGLAIDDIRQRPETPASHFDPEHIRAAVETLVAIYNDHQKYNKEAKNYLLQIKMANGGAVAGSNDGSAESAGCEVASCEMASGEMASGVEFQNVFFANLRLDNPEEDNTAQIIDTMNEFLVSEDRDEDMDSNSAASESNASERTVEDEAEDVQEARDHKEANAEEASNTTTSTLTNSLVIYVQERNASEDSGTDGLDDIEVVSCIPNIFQNVIVRRVARE